MTVSPRTPRIQRFGVFEYDPAAGELRKQGMKIKLHGQPIEILRLLLDQPGEVVTREELQRKLWPADTFVDFEHSLNAAVKRLRDALDDSAETPRYIETLPRRGYRWMLQKHPQSVAVLPLRDLSKHGEDDYFADGLTEALITALAKLGGFQVVSRTSAMLYKSNTKSIPIVAQELGVDAVVEGSVIRTADRVRVATQMIDARSDKLIWSETYDRDLGDILALQNDVSSAVAASIRANITAGSRTRAPKTRRVNPESYDLYLRGRFYWNKRTAENLRKAIGFFQEALDLDPLYAPAYAGIADSYCYLGYSFGRMEPRDAMPKAKAAAERALEIDSQLAEAYCSSAMIRLFYDWDWPGAEKHFERAIQLNPSYGVAYHFFSLLLGALWRNDESIGIIQRGIGVDPLSLPINTFAGLVYFAARDFDRALLSLQKTIEMDPTYPLSHSVLGSALEAKGLHDQAVDQYVRAKQLSGHSGEETVALQEAFALGGIQAFHEKDLAFAMEQRTGWHQELFVIATLCAAVGRKDEAMEWLERAYEARSGTIIWINMGSAATRSAHFFDNMRSDARFQDLMRRLQLPL